MHGLHRQFPGVTQFHKGGQPKAPPPPLPPVPTTAADNASAAYRAAQHRRAVGFSQTILTGGMEGTGGAPAKKQVLGAPNPNQRGSFLAG